MQDVLMDGAPSGSKGICTDNSWINGDFHLKPLDWRACQKFRCLQFSLPGATTNNIQFSHLLPALDDDTSPIVSASGDSTCPLLLVSRVNTSPLLSASGDDASPIVSASGDDTSSLLSVSCDDVWSPPASGKDICPLESASGAIFGLLHDSSFL
ncbi:hypothetical protein EMCRGX_G027539 [Ephydatia muelleri]